MDHKPVKGQTKSHTASGTEGKPHPRAGSRLTSTSRGANKAEGKSATPDAIALLTADHKRVQQMFKDYEKLGDKAQASKEKLAQQLCRELTIHARIEEEIFYPAVRASINDDDLMDEADVEHAAAKDLIAQIKAMDPTESHYDAKVKVLGEEIEHHVEEEQDEMFAQARKSDVDLDALGEQMAERKSELEASSSGAVA